MIYFIRSYWRGEVELAFSFWAVGIVFSLIFVEFIGMTMIEKIGETILFRVYGGGIVAVNIFVLPGIWRSAGMYQGAAIWSFLARFFCLLLALRIGYTFFYYWQSQTLILK